MSSPQDRTLHRPSRRRNLPCSGVPGVEQAAAEEEEADAGEGEHGDDGPDDDESEDEEELDDPDFVVKCQGCGATEDDELEGRLWVQCGSCATWMHGRCVGRFSLRQCEDRDFTCLNCQLTEARTTNAARRTTVPSRRRQCTPWCPPPGCAGGKGCDEGMGFKLTQEQRELVEKLVLQDAEFEHQYHSMAISPKPNERAAYDHPHHGPVECSVVSWQMEAKTATVRYFDRETLKERAGVSFAQIVRFAPRWTDSELDAEAKRIGMTTFYPPRKQLKFEMRRVRQRYHYKRPMTPAEYIKMCVKGASGGVVD